MPYGYMSGTDSEADPQGAHGRDAREERAEKASWKRWNF